MRRWFVLGAVAVLGAVGAACSGDDESTSDTSAPATASSATTSEPVETSVDRPATTPPTSPTTTEVSPTSTIAETIATVPDEGVPGIESDDRFCRAWSEFAGSFQALTLVSSFGDPVEATRLEVVASGAVTSAVATLAVELPAEVEAERSAFLDDLIGPFARRAERAVDQLDAASLTGAQIDDLGDAWLTALVDAGVDDPDIVVVVPEPLDDPLGSAVVAFAASVPPIPADPSLVTDAQAPATLAYLADNCPDQGILAGNDVIDG